MHKILSVIFNFLIELIKIFYYKNMFKHKINLKNEVSSKKVLKVKEKINLVPCQRSKEYKALGYGQINLWGCYFLCILYLALLIKKVKTKRKIKLNERQVIDIFKSLKNNWIIKKNAYVLNPDEIIKYLTNNDVYFEGVKGHFDDYLNKKGMLLISQYDFKNSSHFVLETTNGTLIFDPLSISNAYTLGVRVSVRPFCIRDLRLSAYLKEFIDENY